MFEMFEIYHYSDFQCLITQHSLESLCRRPRSGQYQHLHGCHLLVGYGGCSPTFYFYQCHNRLFVLDRICLYLDLMCNARHDLLTC